MGTAVNPYAAEKRRAKAEKLAIAAEVDDYSAEALCVLDDASWRELARIGNCNPPNSAETKHLTIEILRERDAIRLAALTC